MELSLHGTGSATGVEGVGLANIEVVKRKTWRRVATLRVESCTMVSAGTEGTYGSFI